MKTLEEWEKLMNELIANKPRQDAIILQRGKDFACKAHAGALRKSTLQPYIVHPYEVCLVASTVTDDVDVLVAALLHDVVEDTDYTAEDIRQEFGDRITGFVADESEDKMENISKVMSWMIRKEKFLEHLKVAPVESKTICLADKISNLRSTVESYEEKGDDVWNTFNQKDPKRHAWYYRTIADTIRDDFVNTEAFGEYQKLFRKLFGEEIFTYFSQNGGLVMTVNQEKCDDMQVTVSISGRITSANADEFYDGANNVISANPGKEMIYDVDKLEMISSAGLRVFLKLKKNGVKFKIINVRPEVYEVFDMTGFVDIFEIKKAYRKMSVDGCVKIGEGAKGIVYKIDDETIIKVYKDPDCINDIINERECAKKALVMGVPTAIPFDIVLVGDRFGSVYELVNAKSVTKTILSDFDNCEDTVKEYAKIMKGMHEVEDDGSFGIDLPSIKDEVKVWADFAGDKVDDSIATKIQQFADSITEDKTLLHGDGHPNNVMCTKDGLIMIDMDTLCTGDSRADLAVIYTALIGYKVVDPENDFIPMSLEQAAEIWKIFLKYYCDDASEEEKNEVELWCKKFTYLRLFRRGVRKETDKPYFAQNAKKELEKAFA